LSRIPADLVAATTPRPRPARRAAIHHDARLAFAAPVHDEDQLRDLLTQLLGDATGTHHPTGI
jgi:hypothetical protein